MRSLGPQGHIEGRFPSDLNHIDQYRLQRVGEVVGRQRRAEKSGEIWR